MKVEKVQINRAPVLTLWASVVAQRLGFDEREALSLGKAVSGLTAQSKGQRLGIFTPSPERVRKEHARKRGEEFWVELCGRAVPAINATDGVRAVVVDKPIEPESVERYLRSKFGDALEPVRKAMVELASSYGPEEVSSAAFGLYLRFRPAIPEGVAGWGAKGGLDLDQIRALAARRGKSCS